MTAEWPSRRSSHSPNVCQSHAGPGVERVEGHALDPRHHAHDVVDVGSALSGAIVNPQLPPITVVTPCSGDGLAQRVPEQLGVVVRVDVDEPGRDHEAVGVDGARRGLVGRGRRATMRPSRIADVGRAGAARRCRRRPLPPRSEDVEHRDQASGAVPAQERVDVGLDRGAGEERRVRAR